MVSEHMRFATRRGQRGFLQEQWGRRCCAAASFDRRWPRRAAGRNHQRCDGPALVAGTRPGRQTVQGGSAGIRPRREFHGRRRRRRHPAPGAGARTIPAGVRCPSRRHPPRSVDVFHAHLDRQIRLSIGRGASKQPCAAWRRTRRSMVMAPLDAAGWRRISRSAASRPRFLTGFADRRAADGRCRRSTG